MGESGIRMACERFRLTTVIVLTLEAIFLVLFGVFVRYDRQLGMPSSLKTTIAIPSTRPFTASPSSTHYANSTSSPSSSDVSSNTISSSFGNDNVTTIQMLQTLSSSQTEAAQQTTTPIDESGKEHQEEPVPVEEKNRHVVEFYSMFQDIHVMMFIGFGFLMTFLKKYGFSSVGFNFLIAAFVLQWATLTAGWIREYDYKHNEIHINMETLINADFAAATILISFGAVLGKVSSLQLIIMALIEVVFYQVNELFVFDFLKATDVGDSMVVHTFGAYFGLAVAWINYRKEVEEAEDKEGSVYHSDLFSMIGTIFLWLFWPSFNGGTAADEGRLRAVINTYYSLTASTIVTFAISALVHKDKFNMVHIQNSTLAGGVAIGTLADLIIQPWAAILVGSVAGVISVFGFRYLTPFMSKRMKLHDTCGVHNLHGMPGLLSGLGSILAAGLATQDLYGDGLTKIFTDESRTRGQLAGFQAAALFVSLGMGLIGGAITGVILRLPIWNRPTADEIFDDEQGWLLPSEATYTYTVNGANVGEYEQTRNGNESIGMEMGTLEEKHA